MEEFVLLTLTESVQSIPSVPSKCVEKVDKETQTNEDWIELFLSEAKVAPDTQTISTQTTLNEETVAIKFVNDLFDGEHMQYYVQRLMETRTPPQSMTDTPPALENVPPSISNSKSTSTSTSKPLHWNQFCGTAYHKFDAKRKQKHNFNAMSVYELSEYLRCSFPPHTKLQDVPESVLTVLETRNKRMLVKYIQSHKIMYWKME